jgi:hypothetical protein
VSIAAVTLERLKARSAASGESLGREIDFAVREADADHSRLRHSVGNALGAVPFKCCQIRDMTKRPEIVEAVGVIEACIGLTRTVMARPAGEYGRGA